MPGPDETIPYYGRRLIRTYRRWSDVKLFMESNKHKKNTFRIFEAETPNWIEVTDS